MENNELINLKFQENIMFELGSLMMEKNKLMAQIEILTAENKHLKDELEKKDDCGSDSDDL